MQRVTFRDADLRLHQVNPRDHLGDRVLDLHARVDLDEVPAVGVGIEKKFDGACIPIARLFGQGDGGATEPLANRRREMRSGGDFDAFLVTALNGTVAFPKMEEIAVMVGEDLNFQMARARDVFFEEHRGVAEGGARLLLGFFEATVEVGRLMHDAHAAAAAAHCGFDDHGITNVLGEFTGFGHAADGSFSSG